MTRRISPHLSTSQPPRRLAAYGLCILFLLTAGAVHAAPEYALSGQAPALANSVLAQTSSGQVTALDVLILDNMRDHTVVTVPMTAWLQPGALESTPFRPAMKTAVERLLAFHGSGHANHIVFFNNLRPKELAKPEPEGSLLAQIQLDFGSFDEMKDQLTNAAVSVEGSGWGALVYDPTFGRLYTLGWMNHQNSAIQGAIPLLLCDVWEHAYYLKYQNRRAEYVNAWWNVVDWANVEERFEKFVRCTI